MDERRVWPAPKLLAAMRAAGYPMSHNGFYNALHRGDIKAIRIGSRFYINDAEVRRLLGDAPNDGTDYGGVA